MSRPRVLAILTGKMSESPSDSPLPRDNIPDIPIEIVTDEEMALIEAALAFAAARPSLCLPTLSPPFISRNAWSISSITPLSQSKRRLSQPDIEDSGDFEITQNKKKLIPSFLDRFRNKKALSVTDITATEWCEKQMELCLLVGKRKATKAMKRGRVRHAQLEEEVIKRVPVKINSREDCWALKLMNFIFGVNQLLFEGLTRELPLIVFVEGIWMVGVIDEIRMPQGGDYRSPKLVDTKTRVRDTLPAEPQQRNGRLQLMCYKYFWDILITDSFPSEEFFQFFSLNPLHVLSEELIETSAGSGFTAKTLDDLMRYFRNTCSMLSPADNQLLLRYESQKDQSLLGEDHFAYDSVWLKNQIQVCLEFWQGEREATYIPEEERWKCRICQFASSCSAKNKAEETLNPTNSDAHITQS